MLTSTPRKKLSSLPQSTIFKYFQNQEYRLTFPKSRTRLAKKEEEEEEEHSQLQNVMRITRTQKSNQNY